MSAKKYRMSKCYVTSEKDWVWSSVKMADLWSAVQAINDLIVRIERMENSSEIGSIVLRLDFINRMLVSLDVPDDIVNTTSALYETVVAIDRENHRTQAAHGYQVQLHRTGARGRPSFEITREQLSFLLDQGFKVPQISVMLGVGQRTIERRMSAYGLSVSGENFYFTLKKFELPG